MQTPNSIRERRSLSLRERFQPEEAFQPGEDPLVRLGGLYHLGRMGEQVEVQQRLLQWLNVPEDNDGDAEVALFNLHAAVILAQQNIFEGIEWIVQRLTSAQSHDQQVLAETALRNCSQFPLAVLLAQAIDLSGSHLPSDQIASLMRHSEDDLFALAQRSQEEQNRALEDLTARLQTLHAIPRRLGREIALGTVISRPVQKDYGYRYTGFVSVNNPSSQALVVPYDLSDVLNRDDRHARQNVWQMLGQPGRRAIVVYDNNSNHEVQALYALPFAPLPTDEIEQMIADLALESAGLDIAAVIGWTDADRRFYRMITATGQSRTEAYRSDQQRIGDCFLIHPLNSKPLSTRYRVDETTFRRIVRRFAEDTPLDLAVHINSRKNRHFFITREGDNVSKPGELLEDLVYVVEASDRGKFVFHLPESPWQPEDRSHIFQAFFERQPQAFGVVLEVFEGNDGISRARVVRAQSGEWRVMPVRRPLEPGSLAYWENNSEGRSFATLIDDQQIVDGCSDCFGSGFRICSVCEGSGKTDCPTCEGSGEVGCGYCNGTGKYVAECRNCNGTGTWVSECNNCEGSGTYHGSCRVCGGTGSYADSGRTCLRCDGSGSFTAPCRKCSGEGSFSGTCRRCEGTGQWIEPCKSCRGSGLWECGQCHGRRIVQCDECEGSHINSCECSGEWRGVIVPADQR